MSEEVRSTIVSCLRELGGCGHDLDLNFHQHKFSGTRVHGISIGLCTTKSFSVFFLREESHKLYNNRAFILLVFTIMLITISGFTVPLFLLNNK